MDWGFIILRHVNSEQTNHYWMECYQCLRRFYSQKIVIIDDASDPAFLKEDRSMLHNCIIIDSEFPKRGELLPYYYFHQHRFFQKAIILHDSVFLQRPFPWDMVQEDIQFLWSFAHAHDDEEEEWKLLEYLCADNTEMFEDLSLLYQDKEAWWGCFGVQSMIDYKFLCHLQEKYNLFRLMEYIDTRTKRMALERIFALLCTKEYSLKTRPALFGSIHWYNHSYGLKWKFDFKDYIQAKQNDLFQMPLKFFQSQKLSLKNIGLLKVYTGR